MKYDQKKTEMTYKGIEIKEFESEKPVIFDPPRKMLVWDYDDEIPEVMCRRATNRELAKWLVLGNGQYRVSGGIRIWTEHPYDIGQDDDACSDFIKARKWGDKEWHEPTLEYLGLERGCRE